MKKVKTFFLYMIVAAVFALMFYNPIRIRKDIEKHSKYTICTVFKKSSSLKSGERYHYYFSYLNTKYEGYDPTNRNYKVSFGNRYLVHFSYKDPDHSKILYDYPVADNIVAPGEGWSSIPASIPQIESNEP